jgi:hypothetical protein
MWNYVPVGMAQTSRSFGSGAGHSGVYVRARPDELRRV